MPFDLNRTEIIGRLGHDPELRFTPEGQAVTRCSVATDRPARTGEQAGADWHRVVCWGKLAEFAGQHLQKGRLVFVAGRLTYRSWEGRDGKSRHAAEIVANQVILLDRRPEAGPDTEAGAGEASDDLPF